MNVTDYLQTWAASYKEDFVNNIMPLDAIRSRS